MQRNLTGGTLPNVHCKAVYIYSGQSTEYNVQCTAYRVPCTVYTVQCTELYTLCNIVDCRGLNSIQKSKLIVLDQQVALQRNLTGGTLLYSILTVQTCTLYSVHSV